MNLQEIEFFFSGEFDGFCESIVGANMGNTCVSGKIAKDGFLHTVSNLWWPNLPHLFSNNQNKEKHCEGPSTVKQLECPNPVHNTPP